MKDKLETHYGARLLGFPGSHQLGADATSATAYVCVEDDRREDDAVLPEERSDVGRASRTPSPIPQTPSSESARTCDSSDSPDSPDSSTDSSTEPGTEPVKIARTWAA